MAPAATLRCTLSARDAESGAPRLGKTTVTLETMTSSLNISYPPPTYLKLISFFKSGTALGLSLILLEGRFVSFLEAS